MRKIQLILLILTFSISCKAQVFDVYDNQTDYGEVNGAYYKDVTGLRNRFVGTWMYADGNTSLTVVIQKRDNLLRETEYKSYHEDILVGEYRYIENGVEKINTLSNININYGSDFFQNLKHNLFGDMYLRHSISRPRCNECQPNEKRMVFSYTEPNYDAKGVADNDFVVRQFVENGVDKIKVWFYGTNPIARHDANGNPIMPAPYKVPFGEYILIKQ